MSNMSYNGLKAAVLIENGCCERELFQSMKALEALGITCHFISSDSAVVKSWNENKIHKRDSGWASDYAINEVLEDGRASSYDVLVIPGGRRSLEKLSLNKSLRTFISGFISTQKPVIAYNGAISLLGNIDLIKGYSVAATQDACQNAKISGIRCASPEFVVSKNLITLSRYRDAEQKLVKAIISILNGDPYIEKIVSSENIPRAHSAA